MRATAALLERLDALAAAHSDDSAKVLHELKGSSRMVGAEELGALSEQAEALVREGRWDALRGNLDALRRAHSRFADAAASLRGR